MNVESSVVWAGIDVGAKRKGFHVAVVDDRSLRAGPAQLASPSDVVEFLHPWHPRLVAVDSPRRLAPDGARSRPEERRFAAARICGLRYTPDRRGLEGNPRFYEWISQGLELYDTLERAGLQTIECFPTAAWTRWYRSRGRQGRGRWSRAALARLRLRGIAARTSQDERDAMAAALVARQHAKGRTDAFGDLIVPRQGDTRP